MNFAKIFNVRGTQVVILKSFNEKRGMLHGVITTQIERDGLPPRDISGIVPFTSGAEMEVWFSSFTEANAADYVEKVTAQVVARKPGLVLPIKPRF